MNPYVYVGGNPVMAVDPLGLKFMPINDPELKKIIDNMIEKSEILKLIIDEFNKQDRPVICQASTLKPNLFDHITEHPLSERVGVTTGLTAHFRLDLLSTIYYTDINGVKQDFSKERVIAHEVAHMYYNLMNGTRGSSTKFENEHIVPMENKIMKEVNISDPVRGDYAKSGYKED